MSSTSSRLQPASTIEELIAAIQQIVTKNDSRDRSEENVAIILTSKIQLIRTNRTNQDLLQALGEFFLWMMPYTESLTGAEREAEDEEPERGNKICSRKEIEDLFVRHLLPSAKASDAIYSLCRAVCLVALKPGNTCFVTAGAREELLKLVKNAPCEKSLQWALQAIYYLTNIKKDGVPIESNPFVCDEVCAIAYKLFCESTVSKIAQLAGEILVGHSHAQFCVSDPDGARKMLRKLDESTETETISSIALLVLILIYRNQCNMQLFASAEAARVFLSKLTSSEDPEVLQQVCACIANVADALENISDDFASPEMCRAIFKCFSKQKDEFSKNVILYPIAALVRVLPRSRSTFAQECPDLTQALIGTLATATHHETRCLAGTVIVNISLDAESAKRLFNNVSLYDALIHAASRAQDEETKNSLQDAMHNATVVCTDFLPICAARYPFYDERQIELLKLDSLDSLISNLENNGWAFASPQKAAFLKLRSIFIVLEKFDQFLEVLDQRIEAGDARIEEMLLTIAKGFVVLLRTNCAPLLGDPFVDVSLSLLERSSGAANAVFANVIYTITMNNPNFTIHPSTVLRLLQKLDNSKELRDREDDVLKMEFEIYKVLEEAIVRNPELFRDNNFLVDNSTVIKACFERSFQIHEFDTNPYDKSQLKTHLEALYEVDPRMKEKMEGWDRQDRQAARESNCLIA